MKIRDVISLSWKSILNHVKYKCYNKIYSLT